MEISRIEFLRGHCHCPTTIETWDQTKPFRYQRARLDFCRTIGKDRLGARTKGQPESGSGSSGLSALLRGMKARALRSTAFPRAESARRKELTFRATHALPPPPPPPPSPLPKERKRVRIRGKSVRALTHTVRYRDEERKEERDASAHTRIR